jgi:hypothetical protein
MRLDLVLRLAGQLLLASHAYTNEVAIRVRILGYDRLRVCHSYDPGGA